MHVANFARADHAAWVYISMQIINYQMYILYLIIYDYNSGNIAYNV